MYGDSMDSRHRLCKTSSYADYRHQDKWNAVFCDGHVGNYRRPDPEYDSASRPWANR